MVAGCGFGFGFGAALTTVRERERRRARRKGGCIVREGGVDNGVWVGFWSGLVGCSMVFGVVFREDGANGLEFSFLGRRWEG